MRTAGDLARYAGAVRAEIAKADPRRLIAEMQAHGSAAGTGAGRDPLSLLPIGLFAAIAVLPASGGLYGVLSTVVRQRTAEMGVGIALGAAPSSIFQLVVGHGLRRSAAGIAAGLIAAFGLTRLMASMLVGVKATDPATFAATAVPFLLIAAIASWLPARRAAGLDRSPPRRVERGQATFLL